MKLFSTLLILFCFNSYFAHAKASDEQIKPNSVRGGILEAQKTQSFVRSPSEIAMENNIKELQDEIKSLKSILENYVTKKEIDKIKNQQSTNSDKYRPAFVNIGPAGLKLKTLDDEYSFKLSTALMVDYANYDDDQFDYADGTTLRYFWIGLQGRIDKDWFWFAESDLAGNQVVMRDFFILFEGFKFFNISLGQKLQPYGMSLLVNPKYLSLIDSSLSYALLPARGIGVTIDT